MSNQNATTDPHAVVESWKGIGALCGKSERWCRYMARHPEHPMPVYKVGGMVRMNVLDYRRWEARRRPAQRYIVAKWPVVRHDSDRCGYVCTACDRTVIDDFIVELTNFHPVSHVGCPNLKE